jgi:protein-arginine kinase activator protein McsA
VIDEDLVGWVEVNTADRGNWHNCPICHSDDLDAEAEFDRNDDEASNHVWCLDCKSTWTEVYKASHREGIEERKIDRQTWDSGETKWREVNPDTDYLCESCTTKTKEVYHRKMKGEQ